MWRAGRAVAVAVAALGVGAAGAACGPSDVCQRYVACQKAYDPGVDTTPYEDGGSCWATAPAAATCNTQCQDALAALSRAKGAPDVCTEDGAGP